MNREEIRQILGQDPLTFEQMKELQQMQLQHDWEKVRNQAAIAAMQSLIGNTELMMTICKINGLDKCDGKVVAKIAVKYADALILELRKSDT